VALPSSLAHKARYDAVPLSRAEVWQHRGSGWCFPRAEPTWWRLWENSHAADYAAAAADDDDDDGAQPAATGAGTSTRDFLLSRSRRARRRSREKRIIRILRKNFSGTIDQETFTLIYC